MYLISDIPIAYCISRAGKPATMKSIIALPSLAVLANALIIPQAYDQGILDNLRHTPSNDEHPDDAQSWDFLPSQDDVHSIFDEGIEAIKTGIDDVLHTATDFRDQFQAQLREAFGDISEEVDEADESVVGHDHSKHTIYQLISKSKHTTRFAKAVDEYPEVVKLLNSTEANYTLFVPVDEAFDDIPKGHEKPSKEFIKDVLLYHVGLGTYPARRILGTHTIATAYDEKFLGEEPQRLRVGLGLKGVNVNFYSRVIAVDIVSLPHTVCNLPS